MLEGSGLGPNCPRVGEFIPFNFCESSDFVRQARGEGELPDPTRRLDNGEAVIRLPVKTAPAQLVPLPCLSKGGTFAALNRGASHRLRANVFARSHRSLGDSPGGAQARVPATRESQSHGGNTPRWGAGKWRRGPPASAPNPHSVDQALLARENPGRPQFGRRIASGGSAPGAHGSLARSGPPHAARASTGRDPGGSHTAIVCAYLPVGVRGPGPSSARIGRVHHVWSAFFFH
ncbi:hypothetical protein NDU88_008309 [Pleurodeles waltl]|uniref:Uncharacterized protein n=1 Tax=Pleurodeles waltl TaxID=8319 RepID=A0AAV7RUA2_PLEWA|nr:hypothetical protein NDU88_008309 [Pleurodeles waltl]